MVHCVHLSFLLQVQHNLKERMDVVKVMDHYLTLLMLDFLSGPRVVVQTRCRGGVPFLVTIRWNFRLFRFTNQTVIPSRGGGITKNRRIRESMVEEKDKTVKRVV